MPNLNQMIADFFMMNFLGNEEFKIDLV